MMSKILYIDPGTGSIIISLISAGALTLLYSLRAFWTKSVGLILGRANTNNFKFPGQLVIYNEGRNYWPVFKPITDAFVSNDFDFIYLTSDKNDPGLSYLPITCKKFYIGKMDLAFHKMAFLEAKMVVATTPQLNILGFKRSKKVKHYCYVSHAPSDVHSNKLFAFDYYDSILCGNSYHIKNLRELEKLRNSLKKILLETGCTYYDNYTCHEDGIGEHVLIAPTWGDRSFFWSQGVVLIKSLLNDGFNVKLRPHPQSWISDAHKLVDIISHFQSNPQFSVDKNTSGSESLAKSKVIITDISSGIIYDFILLYKKLVIAVDFNVDVGGYESSFLKSKPCVWHLISEYGLIISPEAITGICELIKSPHDRLIKDFEIENHLFNFGKAGPVAAKQIEDLFTFCTD